MSFSIFLFAAFEIIASIAFCNIMYDFGEKRYLCHIAGICITLVLSTMLLAFNFKNFHHLMASVKYDHVLPVIYYEGDEKPQCIIDKNKVIYYDSYRQCGQTVHFVLMAWNDKKSYDELNDKKSYDELVKYNSLKDIQ